MKVILSGPLHPRHAMARDRLLLEALCRFQQPIIHFYDWSCPCMTYGCFSTPHQFLDEEALRQGGWPCVKRPTGGGVFFHAVDFLFSLFLPSTHPLLIGNPLDDYAAINRAVALVITQWSQGQVNPTLASPDICPIPNPSFCMASPSPYDLMVEGKKIGGAAQRRLRNGILHQGILSLSPFPRCIMQHVVKDKNMQQAMQSHSGSLLSHSLSHEGMQTLRSQLRDLLTHILASQSL